MTRFASLLLLVAAAAAPAVPVAAQGASGQAAPAQTAPKAPPALSPAQVPTRAPAQAAPVQAAPGQAATATVPETGDVTVATELPEQTFAHNKPVVGIGQPVNEKVGLQPQVTKIGRDAEWMHNYILMPVMVGITLIVLGLMAYVVVRFRRSANPVPSKTTHNTTVEILWTVLPVILLLIIAVPSIRLLAAQYKPAPADALTIKVTGNQWNWEYAYPDNGDFSFVSNMLDKDSANTAGEPYRLGVDERMVVPVGRPVKLLVTGADVIHSWAMPAFWIKMDAVPGRINEVTFTADTPGLYYGQCSELCGIRHAFMPIAVEVVSPANFARWVASKGGTMPGKGAAAANAGAATRSTEASVPPANGAPNPPGSVPQAPLITQGATANAGSNTER